MANITGERSDNNRHVNEGITVAETNQDDGQFNVNLDFKTGRQAMPNPVLAGDGQYNYAGTLGENVLLGQNTVGESASPENDRSVSVQPPNPTLPGDKIPLDGSTVGGNVDFNAVAPYHYGEYPKDNYSVGLNDSPSGLDSAVGA